MQKRSGQRKGRTSVLRTLNNQRERRILTGDATIPRAVVVRNSHARANYVIRETVNFDRIVNDGSSPTFGSFVHTFNDLPNASAWIALFDRYRFLGVKMTFQQSGVQMNTLPSSFSVPIFCTVVDFDDNTAYTSLTTMQRAATAATHLSNYSIMRHYLPRPTRPVYISGVSTGYQEGNPMDWQDLAYPTIPHYGMKWGVDAASPGGQACVYDVVAEYLIEVAGQRG